MIWELGLAGAAAAGLGHGIAGRSSSLFGPCVWRGPRRLPRLALTFDDGPSEATPEVLDLLDVFAIRAAFFQCGRNIERLPDLAREVHRRGHEIGNHTYSHPRLLFRSPARIRREIGATQQAARLATGVEPRLFRPPYGLRWFGLRPALREHGLRLVAWTVIGHDWEWEAGEIARHVLAHVSPGAIICLHDGDRVSPKVDRRRTILALRHLLPRLYERGYHFVPLGEMIAHS